jgi:hypothetical protein
MIKFHALMTIYPVAECILSFCNFESLWAIGKVLLLSRKYVFEKSHRKLRMYLGIRASMPEFGVHGRWENYGVCAIGFYLRELGETKCHSSGTHRVDELSVTIYNVREGTETEGIETLAHNRTYWKHMPYRDLSLSCTALGYGDETYDAGSVMGLAQVGGMRQFLDCKVVGWSNLRNEERCSNYGHIDACVVCSRVAHSEVQFISNTMEDQCLACGSIWLHDPGLGL